MKRVQKDLSSVSDVDWARLAAYIDGEGSILISECTSKKPFNNGRHRLYLRVIVANTDPRLPRWLKETFGGGIVALLRYPKQSTHRVVLKWHVSCASAERALRGALPYMLIKRDQAEVAIAFQETLVGPVGRGVRVTSDMVDSRYQLRQRLHELRWEHHDSSDIRRPVDKSPSVN